MSSVLSYFIWLPKLSDMQKVFRFDSTVLNLRFAFYYEGHLVTMGTTPMEGKLSFVSRGRVAQV